MILAKRRQLSASPYMPVTLLVKEDADPGLKGVFLAQLVEDRSVDGGGASLTQALGTLRDKSCAA